MKPDHDEGTDMPTMRGDSYGRRGGRRSSKWLDRRDLDGFLHRSWMKATGVGDDTFRGRPLIGICNSWSELVNCNVHLRGVAEAVKRGVLQAGGFPREFPVMSLGEALMKPTTMLYRNLMAMDVEESIRSYPLDGVVLLTGCDKTNPASVLGACSADIPAIVVTGGPMLNGHWRGKDLGSCSDCWHYHEELRAGRITEPDFDEIENAMSRSHGHCMTMGTASTMACMTEALGLTLPGAAAIPAVDSRRSHVAEAAGRQIVALAEQVVRPSDVLTPGAFENAIRTLHAISGSTNAIIHLIAYAGRLGIDLPLSRFDELCASTPWLVDLKPAGEHLMEDFYYAGGLPAVLEQIRDLLNLDVLTVTGRTLGENLDASAMQAIVEAVPIVMQCPLERAMRPSAEEALLLGHPAGLQVLLELPARGCRIPRPGPGNLPLSIGPPVTMTAGRSTLAAPMSMAGVVLSQPDSSTTPSSGLARIDSSTSIAMRLRYSMAVGRIRVSPMAMVGNSSGKPPACHTPRLTASATARRWALQCVSSHQELQMPITGRPRKTSSPKPFAFNPSAEMQESVEIATVQPFASSGGHPRARSCHRASSACRVPRWWPGFRPY